MPRKNLPDQFTVPDLLAHKQNQRPLVMATAYDAAQARLASDAGVDALLVGDSVGMTTLGDNTTLAVTLDALIHHTRAVVRGLPLPADFSEQPVTAGQAARGARLPLIIADLPFGSYGAAVEDGVRAAIRLIQAGAHAVKLEGAGEIIRETITRLTEIGVPVMGHLGMTPQAVNQLGGFKRQARSDADAATLLRRAKELESAGIFAIVLEVIPAAVARRVTESLEVPTIGIGAGPFCDGQVQVLHDVVGLVENAPVFRHARRYAEVGRQIREALAQYADEVRAGRFPTDEQSF